MSQTTYNTDPAIGRAGMEADTRLDSRKESRIADGAVAAGLLAGRSDAPSGYLPGKVKALAASPAIGVDVDAIVATGASAAADQTLSGAALDGAVGGDVMLPSRRITLTFDNHTDWDATEGYVDFIDSMGRHRRVFFDIPNGGNATVSLDGPGAARVLGVFIPAQTGAGGTFTVGIAAGGVDIGPFQADGIPLYDASVEPNTDAAEYADTDSVPLLARGAAFVETEDACTPDDAVFARVTIAGSEEAGAFRKDSDSGDAFPVLGASFKRTSAIGGVNVVELDW